MSRGRSARRSAQARWSLERLVAFWAAGLFGAFAAGLYLFGPPASEPDTSQTVTAETPIGTVPAEVAGEAADPNPVAQAPKQPRQTPAPSKLAPLYANLLKLESGSGTGPVTILHLGDSHIAADRITGEVRGLLQARFGNAGRGLMMPGFPFPYYKAAGFSFEKAGQWTVANSLTDEGVYGITGVSLTATAPDAALTLASSDGAFETAELWLLAGPGRGRAVISAGLERKEVPTAAETVSVLRVRLSARASALKIEVVGDGPVTVLGWSVEAKSPGIRYVNLGIPSASVLVTSRFDRTLAASDIAALAPKLVILGYGTNEGFNDALDLAAYEQEYERLLKLVTSAAPEAAVVILGPIDGNRLPRFVKGGARAEAPCRPLTSAETADYGALLAHEDAALARWHEPPKLDEVRALLARIAERHGAAYWDLARAMGGPCSIHRWVNSTPPLAFPDHVHLSDEGSKRLGRVIYETLMTGYDRYRQQAEASSRFAAAGASARGTPGRPARGAP